MLNPIVNLFRSRTFVSALVVAIFGVIVTQVPTLAPYTDTIIPLLVTLVLTIAGGEIVETAAAANVAVEKERTFQAQYHAEAARAETSRRMNG